MSNEIKTEPKIETTIEKPVIKVEKTIVSGDGIAGLFPAPSSFIVEIEYKDKILKFEVMPMDNETFAKIGDKLKLGSIDIDKLKGTIGGMKIISDFYWPALRVVLPPCGVSPKFIDGVTVVPGEISVNRLPLDVGIELLEEIMATSGLGEKKSENRKKS